MDHHGIPHFLLLYRCQEITTRIDNAEGSEDYDGDASVFDRQLAVLYERHYVRTKADKTATPKDLS